MPSKPLLNNELPPNMGSLFRKEILGFLSSLIGYLSIGVFLVLLGLVLFVFPDTSLLSYNFATLDQLFEMAPWVFLILIPAITMGSLAEERQQRTLELLLTKPLTPAQIVLGKYFACVALSALAILPTLIYYYTVYELGSPKGNLDSGAIIGSYMGLLFLASIFCAIGMFASSLSQNQIVGFLLAALLCFLVHFGFQYLSNLPVFVGSFDNLVQKLGIEFHYRSISRGLVLIPDVVYFITVAGWFLFTTTLVLKKQRA